MNNYFAELNDVNVNGHTEKKGKLTYLSWAWAWSELKKKYPDSFYTIYENADGWFYHTDGRTAWVKTGVTVADKLADMEIEHIEYLPVMDYQNKSIPLERITSYDVNTAVQRSLTKACARHGLGLYIYAGEDLPEAEADQVDLEAERMKKSMAAIEAVDREKYRTGKPYDTVICESCGKEIQPTRNSKGVIQSVQDQVDFAQKAFGKSLCLACAQDAWTGKKKESGNKNESEAEG